MHIQSKLDLWKSIPFVHKTTIILCINHPNCRQNSRCPDHHTDNHIAIKRSWDGRTTVGSATKILLCLLPPFIVFRHLHRHHHPHHYHHNPHYHHHHHNVFVKILIISVRRRSSTKCQKVALPELLPQVCQFNLWHPCSHYRVGSIVVIIKNITPISSSSWRTSSPTNIAIIIKIMIRRAKFDVGNH